MLRKRREKKRENMIASAASFNEYRTECLQSLVWGVSYHQTHYKLPKNTNKTLLHREKVGKTQKSKSQNLKVCRTFRRVACDFDKACTACSTSAFAFFYAFQL